MADGFVQSLRMNNLFPTTGFAPPSGGNSAGLEIQDLINRIYPTIEEARKQRELFQSNMMAKQHNNQLAQIAAMSAQQNNQPQKPMNTIYQQNISDLDKAKLALAGRDLDIKQQKVKDIAELGQDKLEASQQLHNMSDSDKLKMLQEGRISLEDLKASHASNLLAQRGKQSLEQIGARGDVTSRQIGERGTERRKTLEQQGDQNLAAIAARTQGALDLKVSPGAGKSITPEQENQQIKNAARMLQNTNPELGQYIKFDDKGNVMVDPKASQGTRDMITSKIYGTGTMKDTELKSDKKKDEKKKDPAGIR